jgi:hypothetical protein
MNITLILRKEFAGTVLSVSDWLQAEQLGSEFMEKAWIFLYVQTSSINLFHN